MSAEPECAALPDLCCVVCAHVRFCKESFVKMLGVYSRFLAKTANYLLAYPLLRRVRIMSSRPSTTKKFSTKIISLVIAILLFPLTLLHGYTGDKLGVSDEAELWDEIADI